MRNNTTIYCPAKLEDGSTCKEDVTDAVRRRCGSAGETPMREVRGRQVQVTCSKGHAYRYDCAISGED